MIGKISKNGAPVSLALAFLAALLWWFLRDSFEGAGAVNVSAGLQAGDEAVSATSSNSIGGDSTMTERKLVDSDRVVLLDRSSRPHFPAELTSGPNVLPLSDWEDVQGYFHEIIAHPDEGAMLDMYMDGQLSQLELESMDANLIDQALSINEEIRLSAERLVALEMKARARMWNQGLYERTAESGLPYDPPKNSKFEIHAYGGWQVRFSFPEELFPLLAHEFAQYSELSRRARALRAQ